MLHQIADRIYYLSARVMPLRFQWQWTYVMRARFYFEQRTPDSWPWRWVAFRLPDGSDDDLICGFGEPLGKP